jgi:hypothetical protein
VIALVLQNLNLAAQFALFDKLTLVDRIGKGALHNATIVPSASMTRLA